MEDFCACLGPKNGEPLCPCAMRNVKLENGCYVLDESQFYDDGSRALVAFTLACGITGTQLNHRSLALFDELQRLGFVLPNPAST